MSGNQQQPFPNLSSKVLNPDGTVTNVWRQFLMQLWMRTGGSVAAGFAALNGNAGQVFNVAGAATSTEAVPLAQAQSLIADAEQSAGSAIITVDPTISPFSFTATQTGALSICSGTVTAITLTRDGVTIPISP
jgi:hypothetical protein